MRKYLIVLGITIVMFISTVARAEEFLIVINSEDYFGVIVSRYRDWYGLDAIDTKEMKGQEKYRFELDTKGAMYTVVGVIIDADANGDGFLEATIEAVNPTTKEIYGASGYWMVLWTYKDLKVYEVLKEKKEN